MLFSSSSASPLSLYSIPVVWFTTFYPMTWKFITIDRMIGYNNVQPRSNTAKFVQHKAVPPKLAARVERMEGAHLNGNEAFPLWTAAILAGNMAGLNHALMNKIALAYVATRVLYNHVYINHEGVGTSWIRSSLFFVSVSMPMFLLIKAANKMAGQ